MSHSISHHWKARRIPILVAWICLMAFVGTPGAYSDDGGVGSGHELPPVGSPQDGAGGSGPVGASQNTLIERSKLIIRLPNLLGWLMIKPPYRDPNAGLPRPRPSPVPAEWQSDVPGCVVTALALVNDIYAIGPSPGGRPVGALPPTTVRTVAFGSIPVSATLQLSQVIDGELEPFRADIWPIGDAARIPCDPEWRRKNPENPAYVRGRLSLTVSEIAIDGVPVDVGNRCRTVAPLDINLWAADAGSSTSPDPWYPVLGGRLFQRKDTSRAAVPGGNLLHPASSDLTIPAFTGCRSASGDDVSRLLTAAIAGPGNELSVRQDPAASYSGDRNDPTACGVQSGKVVCPLDPPPPPAIPVPAD
ncbi:MULTISPECIES: hypothetical protein [unclassified Nocardioides]|jgi:hypothetical protein|uniref:hypothetical protein n=1 Tax=unclassified Nocardioides TaxID=2615069 RepID=UPI001154A875|nr:MULTISPECIES: hypothetical protein [unclassified Nocardioides]TQK69701.1 hypothetical protein FBY23_1467 [Nocardioides sp. SLBN-35]WGY01065.1 hypothetical protein QI633_21310 [Nocardioides sp. QY071]